MSLLRTLCTRRGPSLALSLMFASPLAAQTVDTAAAESGVRDYLTTCAADGGRFWGRSLCGPIILVDPGTLFAVASRRPPGGSFEQVGELWRGRIPSGIPRANFALDWAGERWAMVLLPLPADRYLRLQLLLHESFHGIQPAIGLDGADPLNPHLDERDGRYWLRLELRAMAAALSATGEARHRAARDAVLFRQARHQRYPGADTLEQLLERQEGLPEYTGAALALDALGLPLSRAAQGLRAFEGRPSYARALGYGTGPGLGLLLDQYAPGWRSRVAREGFARQLAAALEVPPRAEAITPARAAAARYDGDALAQAEDARAAERQRVLADYRARLIEGPVVRLSQERLMRAFDPNTLIPFGAEGTIYPTGSFSAAWGTLEVEKGGALAAADYSLLRLQAPAVMPAGSTVKGDGWTLELAPGWSLRSGERRGDLIVVPPRQ